MYIVSVLKIFSVLVSVWVLLISIISVSVWVSVTGISLRVSHDITSVGGTDKWDISTGGVTVSSSIVWQMTTSVSALPSVVKRHVSILSAAISVSVLEARRLTAALWHVLVCHLILSVSDTRPHLAGNFTLFSKLIDVFARKLHLHGRIDPWVDRGTCPPYFLKWRGRPVFCTLLFGSRHCLLFEELLILTETPCIGVHYSNFHEI